MLDKSIPYKNIIMRAERFDPGLAVRIPEGYTLKRYEKGDEAHWAQIETSVGEFDSEREAHAYFTSGYLCDLPALKRRCLFVLGPDGRYAGTCTAWRDRKGEDTVGSLHWLAVSPEWQGRGLGKLLIYQTLLLFRENDEFPVYLHTQTWSHKAILLYSHFGFRLLKSETFSNCKNDYEDAVEVLKGVLKPKDLQFLTDNAE